ncbi:DMT family transporter [Acidovorax sp. sif1233]|uniref:DMT family transporter n=1 Tax=Acidovorax sp. sif1233 TaxID=2854792 RepID=UPI001C487F33|nr:DMT family transporter [Acidovorax sp. sif1233]MBV7458044.1 DMT family transporter [Acidovorax sp. sif1233]
MSDSFKGQLLCSLAMVLVGSTVVASKVIGQDIEPFLATVLRHALALPVFFALMRWRGQRLPRVGRRDAVLLTVQAAAGSVGYSVLLILGVTLSSASDAGIVAGTLPAAAALLSAVVLGERPAPRLVLAIGLATLGVMAVAFSPGGGGASPARLAGIALVLAAVACEAVFILAHKRLARPVPALALSTLMSAGGLLLSALPAAWLAWRAATPLAFGAPALAGVLYYAWVPTVGGFLLWYAGSARTSGVRASLATVWLPVSALVLSVLLLGESVRPWQWAGLACVLLAMVLAARGAPERATARGERATLRA